MSWRLALAAEAEERHRSFRVCAVQTGEEGKGQEGRGREQQQAGAGEPADRVSGPVAVAAGTQGVSAAQ